MFTRRKFLAQTISSVALMLGAARLAKANVGGWAQQQGGSQDLQTGLVWLDYTLLSGSLVTYTYAISEAASFVDPTDGYDDWRLPTLNEMITAWEDGIDLNCPLTGGPGPDGNLWWSSTKNKPGKYAYAVDLTTGTDQLLSIEPKFGFSAIAGIFVRQGTL